MNQGLLIVSRAVVLPHRCYVRTVRLLPLFMGHGLARIQFPYGHSVLYSEFDELEVELKATIRLKVSLCLGPLAGMELNDWVNNWKLRPVGPTSVFTALVCSFHCHYPLMKACNYITCAYRYLVKPAEGTLSSPTTANFMRVFPYRIDMRKTRWNNPRSTCSSHA